MKRLFLAGSVLVSSLLVVSCSTNSQETLKGFSEHLQERNCQTQGTVIIGGPMSPVTGQMSWTCPKPTGE